MYADIDRHGQLSIFELSTSEVQSLLQALIQYRDYCSTATTLFRYREDLQEDGQVMEKMIRQIECVIQSR